MTQTILQYEQLFSEESNVSLPSRRRHWMNTQFDYEPSETDDEPSGAMPPIPTYPQDPEQPILPPDSPTEPMLPEAHGLPQLFSEHELARSIWPYQKEDSNISISRPSSPPVDETAVSMPKPPPLLQGEERAS